MFSIDRNSHEVASGSRVLFPVEDVFPILAPVEEDLPAGATGEKLFLARA